MLRTFGGTRNFQEEAAKAGSLAQIGRLAERVGQALKLCRPGDENIWKVRLHSHAAHLSIINTSVLEACAPGAA